MKKNCCHNWLKLKKLWTTKTFLSMRLTFYVLLLATIQGLAIDSYAQATKLNLNLSNTTVKQVLSEIEDGSEFYFLYNSKLIDVERKVDVKFKNKKIDEALDLLFNDTQVSYNIVDRQIVLSGNESIKTNTVSVQQNSITGTVSDDGGLPLPGVTVIIKGSIQGTITDLDGKYSILNIPENSTLVFSFVGMRSQEIVVDGESSINVIMHETTISLDEVVAVGYGTAKRSDLTGAISSVKGDDLVKGASSRAIEALQGKAAGVSIIKDSGRPGNGVKVRIRGIGTINNSNPLYVIDGVPNDNMDNVEANDILNIEVLKDASSTAIYGSRGANGVIMVTTKSGSLSKKPVFAYNSYYSVENVKHIDVLNGSQFAQMMLEAGESDGNQLTGNKLQLLTDAVANKTVGTNWQDEVLQTGIEQNHQVSVTGGIKNDNDQSLKYYISGSYNDQKGTGKNTGYNRYNFLSKLEFAFSKKVTAGLDINYTNSERNGGSENDYWGDPLPIALIANPLMLPKEADGSWGSMWFNEQQRNAAYTVQDAKDFKDSYIDFGGRAWVQLQLMDGLSFKTIYSYSNSFTHTKNYSPQYYLNAVSNRNNATLYELRNGANSWYWNNILTYKKMFNNIHSVSVMLGHEATHYEIDGFNITSTDGVSDLDGLRYIDRAKAWSNPQTDVNETGIESFFGRLTYSYKHKYTLNAIVRRDGSYKFAKKNRWGTFPSVGLAWRLSEEEFIQNTGWSNNIKIRANWGRVGNESSAQAYAYLSTVNVDNMYYAINGNTVTQGGIPTSTVNPDLKWETVESSNIAVDLGFFDNKLTVSADYFVKNTKDMIVQVPTPDYTTNSDPFVNIGEMQNKGFELTFGYGDQSGDFSYNINGNISFISNEVKNLGSRSYIQGGFTTDKLDPQYVTRTEAGKEIAYFIGFQTDGLYKSQEEINATGFANAGAIKVGDIKFVDQNGDHVLDAGDYKDLGSAIPDFTYGINGYASYKNFDFSVSIVGSQGNEIINAMTPFLSSGGDSGYGNLLATRLNRYDAVNNPDGTEARVTIQDPNKNFFKMSDLFVENGSFLKIKTIQLGYNLPENLISKVNLTKLRLYVTGKNLITFTKYSGYDPEISEYKPGNSNTALSSGIDMANYPLPKSFVVGLNITF